MIHISPNSSVVELDMDTFPERLKFFRMQRKLTQVRLAEMLEVSPRVYNRWEKGTSVPHFETIVEIANILDVSLDELAGRKEPSAAVQIHNHRLHSLCKQVDCLPDEDQNALIVLMDSLVKKNMMTRVMTS